MFNEELFDFIEKSPTPYHATETVAAELRKCGFTELYEGEVWNLDVGGKYFVVRSGTSLVAFVNNKTDLGYMICASHTDSPTFAIKPSGEKKGVCVTLDTEKYGGTILHTWFDRPLSFAGRVVVRGNRGVESKLVNFDKNTLVIPSVAIHQNRTVNDGYKFNPATDMQPLYASADTSGTLVGEISKELSVPESDILSYDLRLYARERGTTFGKDGEFLLVTRFDDLGCVFASYKAFLQAEKSPAVPVLAIFDNEEVGSSTKQGARSTLLSSVLSRISGDGEVHNARLASSFIVSADNAHAKHPNHPELSDSQNAPTLGGGVVIKYNANQAYATDALSAAVFTELSGGARIQRFANRSDMPSGSTLGSLVDTVVSVLTVDIGIPQLAMHSVCETAMGTDVEEMVKALTAYYSSGIEVKGVDVNIIKN